MAIIEPVDPRQIDLVEWLDGAVTIKPRKKLVAFTPRQKAFRHRRLSILRGIPAYAPRTDDMRQMIEGISNARA